MEAQDLQAKIDRLEARLAVLEQPRTARLCAHFATAFAGRRTRLALLAATVIVPVVAYAAEIGVPYEFSNGTIADAQEVNANFSALVNESNDQDSRLLALEGQSESDPQVGSLINNIWCTRDGSQVSCTQTAPSLSCEFRSDSASGAHYSPSCAPEFTRTGGGVFCNGTLATLHMSYPAGTQQWRGSCSSGNSIVYVNCCQIP